MSDLENTYYIHSLLYCVRKCAISAKEKAEKELAATKDAVVDYEREIEERCHSAVGKFNQKASEMLSAVDC